MLFFFFWLLTVYVYSTFLAATATAAAATNQCSTVTCRSGRRYSRSRWVTGFGSRSRQAQTHSKATGTTLACAQVPKTRNCSEWRGEGLRSPTLPNHEECSQSHYQLPSREVLPRYAEPFHYSLYSNISIAFDKNNLGYAKCSICLQSALLKQCNS